MFQTLYLTLDTINESNDPAFTADEFPLSYGLVALAIFGAGFGLVALGHALRTRRLARAGLRDGALDPTAAHI